MNILLIIADDLGLMAGCYGEPAIQTPNIDRLAAQGTRFDRAFTSTASCSASRSVIYTGLHPHESGQYGLNHERHHFMTFDHVETAPLLMGKAGYHTGIIGKIHVGPSAAYPWDHVEESGTRDVAWVADRTRAYFDERKLTDQPFFLTIGYIDPHRDASRGGFGNEKFGELAPVFSPDDVHVPPFLTDVEETRVELAEYYRAVYRLDRGIGMVLEELDKSGFAEETLVVFVSDNGAPFLNSKTTLFDAGVHLPLIMRMPGQSPGIANPNMVSFIDILPTFLDIAGWKDDSGPRRGRTLLPILQSEEMQPGWDHVFGSHTFHEVTNYWPTRFLRTERYKYHRNIAWKLDFPFSADLYGSLSWEGIRRQSPVMIGDRTLKSYVRRPAEELFDLEADPHEVHNLADDPSHQGMLRDFRDRLEDWQRATNDPWLFRDGVSVRAIKEHIKNGLDVPERFDIGLEN